MFKVVQTPEFVAGLEGISDKRAYSLIVRAARKMQDGLFGDFKPAGGMEPWRRAHSLRPRLSGLLSAARR